MLAKNNLNSFVYSGLCSCEEKMLDKIVAANITNFLN